MPEEERITTYSGPRQGPPEEVRELRHGVHREGEGAEGSRQAHHRTGRGQAQDLEGQSRSR